MKKKILLLIISIFIMSCGQNENKQKELELKERELALKEKELYLDSIQMSKKVDTTINRDVNPLTPPNYSVEKIKPTHKITSDRDKFIGKFTWSGDCPRGCFYTHVFQQNGKVKTTFETAQDFETYSENWTVDENNKVIKIGSQKWYYKFINEKIKLTSFEYPLDTHELTPIK